MFCRSKTRTGKCRTGTSPKPTYGNSIAANTFSVNRFEAPPFRIGEGGAFSLTPLPKQRG